MKKKRANKIEKPVFRRMFGKRFLIWLLVALMIGFIGSDIAAKVYEREIEIEWGYYSEEMYSKLESIYESLFEDEKQEETEISENKKLALPVEELSEEERKEQFVLWVEHQAYVNSGSDTAYMLLDADTLDIVAQSSYNKLYMSAVSYEQENGEISSETIYVCEDESIIEQLRKEYAEIDYKQGVLKVWIEDMYVDGFTFIPGRVKIIGRRFVRELGDDRDRDILKELDFTPEDTTGYTYIETDKMLENKELNGPWWYHNAMPEMEQFMKETIADSEWRGDLEERGCAGYFYTSYGNLKQVEFESLSVGEGESAKEFWLVEMSQSSFWERYQSELIMIYGGLVFLAFIVALITAYTAYIKQKSFYEMDQYRRNMTNTMAHDLKSPLMVVSGFAENLLEQDLTEKPKHFTKSIMENVQYMNQIIEKVLELSKVENAEYKLQKENVDLRKLSEKLVKNYTAQMDERGLEVKLSGECMVSADELCMTQVLDNLIGNAVKYSIEGSVIEIRLSDKTYEIANTSAVEFDVDVKDLVNPFVKGDNSRSGKKGSGIGLTIAKNLVEQHGYQLELECNDGAFVATIIM